MSSTPERESYGDFLARLKVSDVELTTRPHGRGLSWLETLLERPVAELEAVPIRYSSFEIPKRNGRGKRRILAPEPELKELQRRIHWCVLAHHHTHEKAFGFRPGRSIVDNAGLHVGRSVVVSLDLRSFFDSIGADRVTRVLFLRRWDREPAELITRLCTWQDRLPTGAPSSPRLSNLVAHGLDNRLDAGAKKLDAVYSRYADDLTFSFDDDDGERVRALLSLTREIATDEGFAINWKKLRVRRRHQQQRVTGLVVNRRLNLPRSTRRWLRAVGHRWATTGEATLTAEQLEGWYALQEMVHGQREEAERRERERRLQEERRRAYEAQERRALRDPKARAAKGCFISSACVEAMKLGLDCEELRILTRLGRGYLRSSPEGRDALRRYRRVSPAIVRAIRASPVSGALFERIYHELVAPTVLLVRAGRYREAFTLYRGYVLSLERMRERRFLAASLDEGGAAARR